MITPKNTVIVVPMLNEGTPSVAPYQDKILEILHNNEKYPKNEVSKYSNSNASRSLYLYSQETNIPIIAFDDGSEDDTVGQVEEFLFNFPDSNIQLMQHKKNEGKGAVLLDTHETLPKEVEYIVMTDADIVLPNNLMQELQRLSMGCDPENLPMRICNVLFKQSWRPGSHSDLVIDMMSGSRLIHRQALDQLKKNHGPSNTRDLLNRHPFGLEVALNNALCTTTEDRNKNNGLVTSDAEQNLPHFLPGARRFSDYKAINEQIRQTAAHYYSHIHDKSLRYKALKRKDSLFGNR